MKLKNAHLDWKDNQPRSAAFDDIYFNPDNGAAETRYVFIEGNQLIERLTHWQYPVFSIAETGFGTGSNFLHTLSLIEQLSLPIERLHFISTELFPLDKQDLTRALMHSFPNNHYAQQLIDQYPPLLEGMHRLYFGTRFTLTLCLGDAAVAFSRLDCLINAWFLDGFAPAKNPEMWRDALFTEIARLSLPGTTVSTFTAAGHVRRSLEAVGFRMKKVSGFGNKREMLTGAKAATTLAYTPEPWFQLPVSKTPRRVAVIGAGIAGITTAYALAKRGIQVDLYDSADHICTHASGNRQGALYAKPPITPTVAGQLHLCGLAESTRWLQQAGLFDNRQGAQCGVIQLATTEKEQQRQQALLKRGSYSNDILYAVDAHQASLLAGTPIQHSGIFFPNAGWVNPRALGKSLVAHPNITLHLKTAIQHLTYTRLTESSDTWYFQGLRAQSTSFQGQADVVIIANANDAQQFSQTQHLPLKAIRGQVTHAPSQDTLKTVVCGDGYVSPTMAGELCFGATFDLRDTCLDVRQDDHDKNWQQLDSTVPKLADQLAPRETWQGKVGFRCATPDYLPIVGPAPHLDDYLSRYEKLRKDSKAPVSQTLPPYWNNLFINVGHGSKGLITAPLLAEHLASMINNEPSPLPRDVTQAVHPARFIIRDLIRKKR